MNVGILTFHSSYNFGANLQALAVQAAVERAGAEPVVINYQDPVKMDVYRNITDPAQVSEHERFIHTYLKTSELLSTAEQVESFCRDSLDVVLVGSDQVFRLVPMVNIRKSMRTLLGRRQNPLSEKATKVPSPYWLEWTVTGPASTIKTASLAASAGATSYRFLYPGLSEQLRKCLLRFDSVTVRDRWTEKLIMRLTRGRVVLEYCPDPVFSLRENFIFPDHDSHDSNLSKTILLSIAMESNWIEKFTEEAHRQGYRVASLPNPDREFPMNSVDDNIHLPLSPLKWFQLLSGAAGYIGIRFHALVSCIANNTPVVSIETTPKFGIGYRKKSRLFDLCQRAGIAARCLSSTRALQRLAPQRVLRRLFDASSQKQADRFAAMAKSQFQDTVQRAIHAPQS